MKDEKDQLIRSILEGLTESKTDDGIYLIDEASYSDLSGGFTERANKEYLLGIYETFLDELSWRHGSVWTCTSYDMLARAEVDTLQDLHDDLTSLFDEPCLSDTIRQRLVDEAKEDFITRHYGDIQDGIWKKMMEALGLDDVDLLPDWLLEGTDLVADIFRDAQIRSGRYFKEETGGSVWVWLEKVIDEGFDAHRFLYWKNRDANQMLLFPEEWITCYAVSIRRI